MALAFSYRRWSSPEQAKGDSWRRQTKLTKDWCERKGLQLDETLRMTDAGVSAFRGKNLTDPDVYALAGFLAAVQAGRVPAGSYLVVESFDRLSRDHWSAALPKLLELINAGIKLVQLNPEQIIDDKSDEFAVMGLLVTLARGRNESLAKSQRVGEAWARKQIEAPAKIVTKRLPGWIKAVDGALVLDEAKANTVRRMFGMARDGQGVFVISKTLNDEKAPVIGRTVFKGRAVEWSQTVVYAILRSRAAIGEYVPYKCRGEGRKPQGEPVPGYFPAVVDEATFYAAQKSIEARGRIRGKRGKHINLLAGLLVDIRSGGSMTYRHPKTRGTSQIVPVDANNGRSGKWSSFPAARLEEGILSRLLEVTAADVRGDNEAGNRVETLSGQKTELDNLVELWMGKMDNPATVDLVAAKLAELNARRKALAEAIASAQREAASPLSEAWGEFRSLAEMLRNDPSEELRLKVRSALRRSISSIRCMFVLRSPIQVAGVQVRFVGAGHTRDYIIWNRMKAERWGVIYSGSAEKGDPETNAELLRLCTTFGIPCDPSDLEGEGHDFRNPEHVPLIEDALNAYAEFYHAATAKTSILNTPPTKTNEDATGGS